MAMFPEYLTQTAFRNPQLGYAVACAMAEESFSGQASLTNADLNVNRAVTMQQIPNNCFITDATYDVETPLLAPGSLQRAQQQHYNALHPGVDLKIQISQGWGPSNHVLNVEFQGIQHLIRNPAASTPCCDWLRGKYVWAWQNFGMAVVLKRTLATGEDPYIVSFGLKVKVLPFLPTDFTVEQAISGLAGLGLEIPEPFQRQALKAGGR